MDKSAQEQRLGGSRHATQAGTTGFAGIDFAAECSSFVLGGRGAVLAGPTPSDEGSEGYATLLRARSSVSFNPAGAAAK